MVSMSSGPLRESLALFNSGVKRTFEDTGRVLDLVPPPYMRPIDDEIQSMLELEHEFPGLVKATIIGHSVEGRPIVELHMSNFADPRPKPTVGFIGNLHGDEDGNGPWGVRLFRDVLEGHGREAAATATLNARDFRSIPFANPDGRAAVERGYLSGNLDDLFHRTNANGVDLNRNFPVGYGTTVARRGSAGPHALSEPESRAIHDRFSELPPDELADVHSQGNRILLPYGYDRAPSKHLAALTRIARGMAARNGYAVESSATFTKGGTGGTSKDWAHETFGIPSITVEVGNTHHMTQEEFDDAVLRNRPAMSYFARLADAPYHRARGPQVASGVLDANGGVRVTAAPDGLRHAVSGVEIYRDPLTRPGDGVALQATGTSDAKLAGSSGWVLRAADSGITDGIDGVGQLYARARDSRGNWGPFSAVA
jgi:g-D-glutamyl-meso-diaminopimelate peptidase